MASTAVKEGERKKKRIIKTDPPTGGLELKKAKAHDDISSKDYQQGLFHAEEEEAESRDALTDVKLFQSSCDSVRKAVDDIKQLKRKKDPKSNEIENKRIDASLQFVVLKKLNRLTHFRCRKVREATNEAKQQIDQYHLQLQNLLYEAMHLQKEITKCLEFKSKDEEIELISEQEFYDEAPTRLSQPNVTKSDPHQLTLARLEWELEQRQRLADKLEEAQSSREVISQEIKAKQDYLDSLQPKLNSILQATKPVQSYLDMPYDEIREQHQTAYHLPHPLYVLFMQSSAYREACDKHLKVTIEGDLDAAKSLDVTTPEPEDESDSDQEEQEKPSTKRRRKTVEARLSDKKERVLKKHPLSVVLVVNCKGGSSLQLTFQYLLILKIITVNVKVSLGDETITSSISGGDLLSVDTILSELYPGDLGNTTPNPANQYELSRQGMQEFGQYLSRVGHPYMWAQWMGGLQFLGDHGSEKAKSAVSAAHMQETIKQLRHRLTARLHLLQQLASLERCSIPVSSKAMELFPGKIIAQLTSWKRSTYDDFQALSYTQEIVESGVAKETDMFFIATMERSSARLTAQVVVTPDYPAIAPLFVINIAWQTERNATNDIHIREMEQELNVHYGELVVGKSDYQLLSTQLQRLVMCFDVYLETEVQNVSGPAEIAKEKIFPRTSKGPNRKKPYRYLPDLGLFTHR